MMTKLEQDGAIRIDRRQAHGEGDRADLRRHTAGGVAVRPDEVRQEEPEHGSGAHERDRAGEQVAAKAGGSDIVKAVPGGYLLGDRALYLDASTR